MEKKRNFGWLELPHLLEEKINRYFELCLIGEPKKTSSGKIKKNKQGEPVFEKLEIPTLEGLVYFLEISNVKRFLNLATRSEEWEMLIDDTMNRLTNLNVQKLYNDRAFKGAKFVLQNKYGYQDAKKVDVKQDTSVRNLDVEKALNALGYRHKTAEEGVPEESFNTLPETEPGIDSPSGDTKNE